MMMMMMMMMMMTVIEVLLNRSDCGCRYGMAAIHYAVNDCEAGCLAELIKASADVNALDMTGRSPVWLAAERDGRVEYMKMLVHANCDVNVKDKREKRTPLQVSTFTSPLCKVEALLKKKQV